MKKTLSFVVKHSRVLLLLVLVAFCSIDMTASTYYAKLAAKVSETSPTGSGTVYLAKHTDDKEVDKSTASSVTTADNEVDENPSIQVTSSRSNNKNVRFSLWADAKYGYSFNGWSDGHNGTPYTNKYINSSAEKESEAALNTIEANFLRRAVEVTEAPTIEDAFSWKTINLTDAKTLKMDKDITFKENYALVSTDLSLAETDPQYECKYNRFSLPSDEPFSWNIGKSGSNTDGSVSTSGTATVKAQYALSADATQWIAGANTMKLTLAPTDGKGGTSKEASWNVNVDLTPTFDFQPDNSTNADFEKTIGGGDIIVRIKDFGELPIGDATYANNLTWIAYFSTEDQQTSNGFTVDKNPTITKNGSEASFKVSFDEEQVPEEYRATLTLKAVWTDASGASQACTQTCTLYANLKAAELYIKQGETTYTSIDQPSATFSRIDIFDTETMPTQTFTLTGDGIQWDTQVTSSNATFNVALAADKKSFTVTGNAFANATDYATTITVTMTTSRNMVITQTLAMSVRRWYKDVALAATSDDNSVTLSWMAANTFTDTQYKVQMKDDNATWQDEVTLSYDQTTYTKTGLTADKTYTFRLVVVTGGGNQETAAITKATTLTITTDHVPTPDTKWENCGVDFSAAFDLEGNPIMDELYILDNTNNKCYIYDVVMSGNTPTGYQLRTSGIGGILDPRKTRVGAIYGKGNSKVNQGGNTRVYVTGTCETQADGTGGLTFKGNDGTDPEMGWMQPVNCEVYLDNAHLQAAAVSSVKDPLVVPLYLTVNSLVDPTAKEDFTGFLWRKQIQASASVFYLKEDDTADDETNTTTFHLRGENFLGGGVGYTFLGYLGLIADGTNVRIGSFNVGKRGPWDCLYFNPNYSAPIAIKDASFFDPADKYMTIPEYSGYVWDKSTSTYIGTVTSEIRNNNARIVADFYDIDDVPNITGVFDTIWAVSIAAKEPAFLDLSARTCQFRDSAYNSSPKFLVDSVKIRGQSSGKTGMNMISDNPAEGGSSGCMNFEVANPDDPNKRTYTRWTNTMGKRYSPALVTGGKHGKFIINGGHINLWPANGSTRNMQWFHSANDKIGTMEIAIDIAIDAGHTANYLVCGSNVWQLRVSKEAFKNSGGIISVETMIDAWKDAPPRMICYGIGNGYPVGHLEVRGGTITAETNANSYAHQYFNSNKGVAYAATSNNIDVPINGKIQPLFAPNVVVTGGTFRHPLYGTTNNPTDLPITTSWDQAMTDYTQGTYKVNNHFSEAVYLTEGEKAVKMDNVGHVDYSHYMDYDVLHSEPIKGVQQSEPNLIVNLGKEGKEYRYGMANVQSDASGYCYFYLPKDGELKEVANFYAAADDATPLADFGEVFPYNVTIERGANFTVNGDTEGENVGAFRVYGQPTYLCPAVDDENGFVQDQYQLMAMPFNVADIQVQEDDKSWTSFHGYISTADPADNPSADNTTAYCYIYFFDNTGDGQNGGTSIATQQTAGFNDDFRKNYHTHTDGLMKRGKTYILKFPTETSADGTATYWKERPIKFVGEKGSLVNGANAYSLQTRNERPAAQNTFVMDGNATFVPQTPAYTGEVYLVDAARMGHDDFFATTLAAVNGENKLKPLQGYLLAADETMQKYRIIGRHNTTTGIDATGVEAWKAFAADRHIFVTPVADGDLQVYTVNGELVGTYPIIAGAQTIIPASAGMYILRSGDSVAKVVVP